MKLIDYGRSIYIEYFADDPSDWHDVYIKPATEKNLYAYLNRYFDNKYVPWTSINVYFMLNGRQVGKIIALDYQTDNLFSASQMLYKEYVDGRIWSVDLSGSAKSK